MAQIGKSGCGGRDIIVGNGASEGAWGDISGAERGKN